MNILAVGAHPDDIALKCGGTLAKYAAGGHDVAVAVLCRGDANRSGLSSEEAARLREQEFRRSAQWVSASVSMLGAPDFEIPINHEFKLRLTEVIRRAAPDAIFTHDPDDCYLDHRRTFELVDECALWAMHDIFKSESPPLPRVPMVYLMETVAGISFVPDALVDITAFFDVKCKMIESLESLVLPYQGDPVMDTLEWVTVNARWRGIQAGVRYAEAFRWSRQWAPMTASLLP